VLLPLCCPQTPPPAVDDDDDEDDDDGVYDDAMVVGLDDGGRFRDVFAMMKKWEQIRLSTNCEGICLLNQYKCTYFTLLIIFPAQIISLLPMVITIDAS